MSRQPVRSIARALLFLTLCWAANPVAFAQDVPAGSASARAPVPAPTAREQSMGLIRELYKKDVAAANSPAAKRKLAQKLLETASGTNDDPVGRYVLLIMARDNAVAGQDVDRVVRIIDLLSTLYEIDTTAAWTSAAEDLNRAATDPAGSAGIVEALMPIIEREAGQKHFDTAFAVMAQVLKAARKAGDPALLARVEKQEAEVKDDRDRYLAVAKARAALKVNPDDAEANLVVGRDFSIIKGDWPGGLPFLARSADLSLKSLAASELKNPSEAADQLALANGWWELSDHETDPIAKAQLRRHASVWYVRAQPRLSGLPGALAQRRLEELGITSDADVAIVVPERVNGPTRNLLPAVQVGAEGPFVQWKMTDDGMLLGVFGDPAWLDSHYHPPGDYDLHLVFSFASLGSEKLAPGLGLHVSRGEESYLIDLRVWGDRGELFTYLDDEAKRAGKQRPGVSIRPAPQLDQKYDLLILSRKSGITFVLDGKPIYQLKDFDGVARVTPKAGGTLTLKTMRCRVLVRKFEVTGAAGKGQ